MKPPRAVLDRMRADGGVGELTSMICLGAALAVKRRDFGPLDSVTDPNTGKAVSEDLLALLKLVHADAVMALRHGTADELEHAIGLYTAHLKDAGYTIEADYDN